jgi:Bacterial Ig domain
MTPRIRSLAALVVAALASASVAVAGGPAGARTGTAPVTKPDTLTTYAGNLEFPQVLANDSDAEGDRLKVCGLGPEKYPHIRTDFEKRTMDVDAGTKAKPGTYTFTYYACDGTSQTPGTLTLVLLKPPKIQVRAVAAAHGRLRATSKAPFRVELTYGNFNRDDPEGKIIIPKKGTIVFSTRYHRTDWIARTTDGTFLSQGNVRYVP